MLDENATGTDMMHHQYNVTITPKAEDGDLVVKVNEFEDQVKGARVTTAEAIMMLVPTYADHEVRAATANKYTPVARSIGGCDEVNDQDQAGTSSGVSGGS